MIQEFEMDFMVGLVLDETFLYAYFKFGLSRLK